MFGNCQTCENTYGEQSSSHKTLQNLSLPRCRLSHYCDTPPTTDPWRVRPSVDGLAARGPAGPGSVNRFRRPTVGPVLITARAETVVAADAGSWTARQCESLTDTCSDSWRVGTIAAVSSVCERGARVLQVVDFIREEETQWKLAIGAWSETR